MTGFVQTPGQLEPFAFTLTDTADYTIVTGSRNQQYQIESIWVAADGSGTFTLWVNTGSAAIKIIPGDSMAAGDTLHIENHPLRIKTGWSLVCSASAGNVIDVTASLLSISPDPNKAGAFAAQE